MTDPLPPLSDDDLSALLDGVAGPDVAARADADPTAQARLAELRAAATAVRTLPPVPALDSSTIDDLVGRALAAADEPPVTGGGDPTPLADHDAVVAPLAPRGGQAGVPRWLVAAAIVLLVAVGLGLVWSGRDGGGEDTAINQNTSGSQSFDSSADDAGGDGAPAGAAPESSSETGSGESDQGDVASPTEPDGAVPGQVPSDEELTRSDLVDLGTFATTDELRTALKVDFPASGAAVDADVETPDQAAIDRCQEQMVQVFQEGFGVETPADAVGLAVVDGKTLLVFEFASTSAQAATEGEPTTFVVATDPGTCSAELSFERTPT